MPTSRSLPWQSAPEALTGNLCTFAQGRKLRPRDLRPDHARPRRGSEAAVDAGNDILSADDFGVPADALRHKLRMLDVISGRVDDARHYDLAFRQLQLFKYLPLVLVPRVGPLERNGMRPGLEHQIDDVTDRNIGVMRTLPVSPAQMHAHCLAGYIARRIIEDRQALGNLVAELLHGALLATRPRAG